MDKADTDQQITPLAAATRLDQSVLVGFLKHEEIVEAELELLVRLHFERGKDLRSFTNVVAVMLFERQSINQSHGLQNGQDNVCFCGRNSDDYLAVRLQGSIAVRSELVAHGSRKMFERGEQRDKIEFTFGRSVVRKSSGEEPGVGQLNRGLQVGSMPTPDTSGTCLNNAPSPQPRSRTLAPGRRKRLAILIR